MLIGIAGNVMKQNAISPPPRDASMATEEEAGRGGRNFIRGALLGIGATVLGVLLFGAPEYLAGTVKLPAMLTEPGLQVRAGAGWAGGAGWWWGVVVGNCIEDGGGAMGAEHACRLQQPVWVLAKSW